MIVSSDLRRARPAASGLTLIELIIALAVIAIALLQIVNVIMSSSQLKATSREFTLARQVAASEIEALKARAQANGLSDVQTYILANPQSPTSRVSGGQIFRTCDARNPNLYDVSITVTWVGGAGKNDKFSTSAMIAK